MNRCTSPYCRVQGPVDEESKPDLEEAKDLFYSGRLVERSRRRLELKTRISTLSDMISELRESNNPAADDVVDEITAARNEINAINAELRHIKGAVVSDGG